MAFKLNNSPFKYEKPGNGKSTITPHLNVEGIDPMSNKSKAHLTFESKPISLSKNIKLNFQGGVDMVSKVGYNTSYKPNIGVGLKFKLGK